MATALRPASKTSKSILPVTGTHSVVSSGLPFGIYSSPAFISGAVDQVAYTYKKLGGDVLDIELNVSQVYSAYEESVLEYSYIINIHQAKNSLNSLLGYTTGSFNQDGQLNVGDAISGSNAALKYPKFKFGYANRVSEASVSEIGLGGTDTLYSASFAVEGGQQDYDLQNIISASSNSNSDNGTGNPVDFSGLVGNRKILVKRVYYTTPRAMWRFFGYYGGINVLGNLTTYGQWADDTTFQVVPVWQNKAQALAYEDAIYTRLSHYSYEITNNKLRLYPYPVKGSSNVDKFWVEFMIPQNPWEEDADKRNGADGINNLNTLPFENIPYKHINSIGKQWIRRFALALAKEMLGQIRGKFASIPIPGESVTLNGDALITQGKEEQEKLREELKTTLDELIYKKLAEDTAGIVESTNKINQTIPALSIYRG
ncbi:MAG: hypothetical protein CMI54_00030 [Parcubacteria group bacterium]|nr:hypothetical protein [Parcubacteria group bacterium]|tara:strand:- start:3693 stop:4976 length:1284 start_codon:yes stop_codon:yes gene_type:complete